MNTLHILKIKRSKCLFKQIWIKTYFQSWECVVPESWRNVHPMIFCPTSKSKGYECILKEKNLKKLIMEMTSTLKIEKICSKKFYLTSKLKGTQTHFVLEIKILFFSTAKEKKKQPRPWKNITNTEDIIVLTNIFIIFLVTVVYLLIYFCFR